jgi:hypothetical protein
MGSYLMIRFKKLALRAIREHDPPPYFHRLTL